MLVTALVSPAESNECVYFIPQCTSAQRPSQTKDEVQQCYVKVQS